MEKALEEGPWSDERTRLGPMLANLRGGPMLEPALSKVSTVTKLSWCFRYRY